MLVELHNALVSVRQGVICLLFFVTVLPPPISTLFPYTTLFRSAWSCTTAAGRPSRATRSARRCGWRRALDRKSTRLNSSHPSISYAVFCLKKKKLSLLQLPDTQVSARQGQMC